MYTLTAGAVAGAIESIITYPTEYVKTQLQLQDNGAASARNGGVVSAYTPQQRQLFFFGSFLHSVIFSVPFSLCCCSLLCCLLRILDRVTVHSLCFPFVSSPTGQQINGIQDSNATQSGKEEQVASFISCYLSWLVLSFYSIVLMVFILSVGNSGFSCNGTKKQ